MERRKYLAIAGAVAASTLAGCSGGDSDEEENGIEETEETEEDSAEIVVANAEVSETEIETGGSIEVTVTLENTGDGSGTTVVELQVDEETVETEEVAISPGEDQTLAFNRIFEEAGEYGIGVNGDSIDTIVVQRPQNLRCPDDPPAFREIYDIDDVSHAGAVRYEVIVRLDKEGDAHSDEEFNRLSRAIVCNVVEEEDVNAIAILYYEPDDIVQERLAYARNEWAPYGDWGSAGDVETGDYSNHEHSFSKITRPEDVESAEFEVTNFEIPNSVEMEEEFTVEITVKNKGDKAGEFRTSVTVLGGEPLQKISAEIEPGEEPTIESKPIIFEAVPSLGDITLTLSDYHLLEGMEVTPVQLDVGESFVSSYSTFEIRVTEVERGEVDDISEDERHFWIYIESTNQGDSERSAPSGFEFVTEQEEERIAGLHDREEYDTLANLSPGETESGWLSDRLPKETSIEEIFVRFTRTHPDGEIIVHWN